MTTPAWIKLRAKVAAGRTTQEASSGAPAAPKPKQANVRSMLTPQQAAKKKAAARKRLAQLQGREKPESDVSRIMSIGRSYPMDDEEFEAFCKSHMMAEAFYEGKRLLRPQAEALKAIESGGLFAPIGCGHGKTLISIFAAQHYYKLGHKRTMLCLPPNIYPQLVTKDIPWARKMIPLSVPFHGVGGLNLQRRTMLTKRQRPGCYIVPYSYLSRPDSEQMLENIRPEVLILDEAHRLRNPQAACTKRIIRLIEALKPVVIPMSGTMTSKSILDYWHLIRAALGSNAPVPMSADRALQWARVLDSDASPSTGELGPVRPLLNWAIHCFPDETIPEGIPGFRKAYQLRLHSTQGVVATPDADVECGLVMSQIRVPEHHKEPGGDVLEEKLSDIEDWQTPDGDEIDFAFHRHKWLKELHTGFYYSQRWPETARIRARFDCSESEAQEKLERAQAHHTAQQLVNKLMREFLRDHSKPHLDQPMLVYNEMNHHGAEKVDKDLYDAYRIAQELKFDGMPERMSIPVRLCDWKIRRAVEWAKKLPKGEGALIWVENIEPGKWVFEYLQEAGLDAIHCPSGDEANKTIIDPANADKIAVASIGAHSEGKNLQHDRQYQLFLQFPRSAKTAEQVLARLHREGQKADEVAAPLILASEWDEMNFAACLNDSCYQHQTMGRQRLMFAAYDPLPKIYESAVLWEMGFQNRRLTADQAQFLKDRFLSS